MVMASRFQPVNQAQDTALHQLSSQESTKFWFGTSHLPFSYGMTPNISGPRRSATGTSRAHNPINGGSSSAETQSNRKSTAPVRFTETSHAPPSHHFFPPAHNQEGTLPPGGPPHHATPQPPINTTASLVAGQGMRHQEPTNAVDSAYTAGFTENPIPQGRQSSATVLAQDGDAEASGVAGFEEGQEVRSAETAPDQEEQWSEDEIKQLKELWEKHKNIKKIQETLCNRERISIFLQKNIHIRPNWTRYPWKPCEDRRLVELYEAGKGLAEIEQSLDNRKAPGIQNRLNRLFQWGVIDDRDLQEGTNATTNTVENLSSEDPISSRPAKRVRRAPAGQRSNRQAEEPDDFERANTTDNGDSSGEEGERQELLSPDVPNHTKGLRNTRRKFYGRTKKNKKRPGPAPKGAVKRPKPNSKRRAEGQRGGEGSAHEENAPRTPGHQEESLHDISSQSSQSLPTLESVEMMLKELEEKNKQKTQEWKNWDSAQKRYIKVTKESKETGKKTRKIRSSFQNAC